MPPAHDAPKGRRSELRGEGGALLLASLARGIETRKPKTPKGASGAAGDESPVPRQGDAPPTPYARP